MLVKLYHKRLLNKNPREMVVIIVTRLLSEFTSKSEDSYNLTLEGYINDEISQPMILNLSDSLISEIELAVSLSDKLKKFNNVTDNELLLINELHELTRSSASKLNKFKINNESSSFNYEKLLNQYTERLDIIEEILETTKQLY